MNLQGHSVAYLNRIRATYTNRSEIHKAATRELNRLKRARYRKAMGMRPRKPYRSTFRRRYGYSLKEISILLGVEPMAVYEIEKKGILKHRIKMARLRKGKV
jgi:hypothetical protein